MKYTFIACLALMASCNAPDSPVDDPADQSFDFWANKSQALHEQWENNLICYRKSGDKKYWNRMDSLHLLGKKASDSMHFYYDILYPGLRAANEKRKSDEDADRKKKQQEKYDAATCD